MTYDKVDNIIKETDSLGRVTSYEYDLLHNIVKTTDAEGKLHRYCTRWLDYFFWIAIGGDTMALVHRFAVIPEDSSEIIISEEMEKLEIPDDLLRYFIDTLGWINSSWNGGDEKKGLSYYGFSIIEGKEIKKLINIIEKWKELFEIAPEKIELTGEFLQDKSQYKKELFDKKEVMKILCFWICLCEKAIKQDAKILHNGI